MSKKLRSARSFLKQTSSVGVTLIMGGLLLLIALPILGKEISPYIQATLLQLLLSPVLLGVGAAFQYAARTLRRTPHRSLLLIKCGYVGEASREVRFQGDSRFVRGNEYSPVPPRKRQSHSSGQ